MEPQDPKDVVRDMARDLSALVGALKADAPIGSQTQSTLLYVIAWRPRTRRSRLRLWRRVRLNERQG